MPGCTEMGFQPILATLRATKSRDRSGRERSLYDLDHEALGGRPKLVGPGKNESSCRILQRAAKGSGCDWVLTLESEPVPEHLRER
ncbi:MAG: hypothetical protein O2816_08105 [Planctomycetota bacterium]|nr:hypothetical protein [Planctomycetota bacterium]